MTYLRALELRYLTNASYMVMQNGYRLMWSNWHEGTIVGLYLKRKLSLTVKINIFLFLFQVIFAV